MPTSVDRGDAVHNLGVPEAIRQAALGRVRGELLRVLAALLVLLVALEIGCVLLLARRGKTVLYVSDARSLGPIGEKNGGRP